MSDPKEYGTRLGIFFFFGGKIFSRQSPMSQGSIIDVQYRIHGSSW